MRALIIQILLLVACNQPESTQAINTFDSTVIPPAAQGKQQTDKNGTETAFDSSIYARYVPRHVLNMLEQKIPNWQFMNPIKWESFWFKYYQKDSSLVNYVPGDFNCDGITDYALLLENDKGEMAVWILQSIESGYSTFKLRDIETDREPMDVGIELVPKGKLDYIDLDVETIKTIYIKCPAIQVLFFERAAVTYYWINNKFESVQTGD